MARLMNVKEAAQYLGVPTSHIYDAMRAIPENRNHLRHIRLGRRRFTTQEWLEDWIQRASQQGACQTEVTTWKM
jgi:excisionase family DNA binding protein